MASEAPSTPLAAADGMSRPQVTVVIPVYNTAAYLPDTRACLEAQTLQNYLVIAVDDGSTDDSPAFLEAWAAEDPRITVLSQVNAGQSAARNLALDELQHRANANAYCTPGNDKRKGGNEAENEAGIGAETSTGTGTTETPDADGSLASEGESTGRGAKSTAASGNAAAPCTPYVLFLDSDDMLDPSTLEKLVGNAGGRNLDMLEFTARSFYENEDLAARFRWYDDLYRRHDDFSAVESGPDYLTHAEAYGDFKPSPCMRLLSTSLLLDNDIRFCQGIIHEDNLFTFTCLLFAKRVSFLDEPLYLRRVRPDSTMTRPRTFANVKGYYRCALEALAELDRHPKLTRSQVLAAGRLADDWLRNAAGDYNGLDPKQAQDDLFREFGAEKALLFERLALKPRRWEDEERALRDQVEAARSDARRTEEELRSSTTFRVGSALTALPRALKDAMNHERSKS